MNARTDSPFEHCLREALSQSRVWVPRWLGKLQETLQQREVSASNLYEKQAFLQARTVLASYRDRLASGFILELEQRLQGASVEGKAASARSLQSLSFDDLELMDHSQVQATVELARVQQVVKMAADEELVAFNARLCRAQGLDVVRGEANPLRPDVVVGALMKVLASLHVDEAVRSRWLQVGAMSLGHELQQFYQALTVLLDGLGVEPAGYVVVQTNQARPATAVTRDAVRSDSVPAASLTGGDALLTLDHLHQLLVGNLEQGGNQVSDQGASGSGNAMVRTLAAEVVTLMLRRIVEDQRLLQPIRDMVLRLKPALLQLARSEPRFFADRNNPARRLLDAITSQSLAFTSEQDRGFSDYAQRVLETVNALQGPAHGLPGLLPRLLQAFTAARPDQAAPARGLAMKTLVRVEQRNMLADRVAAEIQARNDFARAPGVVRRFLIGPWAQVVAQARMDAVEPGDVLPAEAAALRYMGVLPDLLWSSQLVLASQNRPRLIKVIPGILRTLREGLDAIDYPRSQSENFFQALMGLHEAAYKTQRGPDAVAVVPEDSPASRQMPDEHELWMQPAEARDSGFMEDLQIESQPAFLDTQPMTQIDELAAPEPAASADGRLAVGCWVDLRQHDQNLRCQLSWASPHGTMFLFTAADGNSISLTEHGLRRLQELGRLRVVADQGVVDEALDAVARQALINSRKL